MKLSHLVLVMIWVFAVTAEAQTRCFDNGRSINCYGDEPASLLRSPNGLGLSGWKDGKRYSYRIKAPDGLAPLPQPRKLPQSQYWGR